MEIEVVRRDENLSLNDEATQLVRLFSTIKRRMKEKIEGAKGNT
jgi:hypothetical protein